MIDSIWIGPGRKQLYKSSLTEARITPPVDCLSKFFR
jgi:hypothetical protein